MVLFADQAYRSPELVNECKKEGLELKVVARQQGWDLKKQTMKTINQFIALPKRWIVERTFAWIGRFRRFSKDYEFCPCTGCIFILLAIARLILNRIMGG